MLIKQLNTQIDLVQQLSARLNEETDILAALIAATLGKPIRYAKVEIERTADLLNSQVQRFLLEETRTTAGSAFVRWRPLGTVAVITPANNPMFIPLSKISCAILYGNSVIWKPAPETKFVSRRMMELLEDVGCPSGLVQMVEGGGIEAEELMQNPNVSAVTLTGSEATGRVAREICLQRNLPLQAELGGNNAAIVWSDADLELAAQSVISGAFEMAGQRCTANRRVIVPHHSREEFLARLVEACRTLTWGDPRSMATHIGPMVSRTRCERTMAATNEAAATCPVAYPYGTAPPVTDNFPACWCPPAIVSCDDHTHEIVQEESFGPVLVVQTARDWDHAMELCNGVRQGLVAALFSRSNELVEKFLEEAQAGMLKINRSTSDAEVGVPFCAWKRSGYGPPKHGMFGRDFYTKPQTVYGVSNC